MAFEQENFQVLCAVQALLSNISNELRAVAIDSSPEKVTLYFVLAHESDECREDISDIIFEFEALQVSDIEVEAVVLVDTRHLADLGLPSRKVFVRKEPECF